MDGWLCPPGGHIEAGETPVQAMIREISEELGAAVSSDDLEFACVAARNTSAGETVAYEFIIRNKNYAFMNAEPEKCSELVRVDLKNLPNDIIPDFKVIIEKALLQNKNYIEVGY